MKNKSRIWAATGWMEQRPVLLVGVLSTGAAIISLALRADVAGTALAFVVLFGSTVAARRLAGSTSEWGEDMRRFGQFMMLTSLAASSAWLGLALFAWIAAWTFFIAQVDFPRAVPYAILVVAALVALPFLTLSATFLVRAVLRGARRL
jgi:hypothetical protein